MFKMSLIVLFVVAVVRLVTKQIQDLVQNPLEGVRVIVNEEDITIVNAIIDGPGL